VSRSATANAHPRRQNRGLAGTRLSDDHIRSNAEDTGRSRSSSRTRHICPPEVCPIILRNKAAAMTCLVTKDLRLAGGPKKVSKTTNHPLQTKSIGARCL